MNIHRFLDAPLLLDERAAAKVLMKLRAELRVREDGQRSIELADTLQTRLRAFDDPAAFGAVVTRGGDDGVSYEIASGVAIVPISGVLVHGRRAYSDEIAYGTITNTIVAAANDIEVRAIALQISSPGGEVSGLFELADLIYGLRGVKPIWAILDDHAYSAAYAIASATDRIVVPRTGGVGSIGVITMHLDVSKLLEEWGIKISIIQYGERKSDYSPFRSLSETARNRLQADVDTVGEMFVEMVGRNRSLNRARVRATEAGIFMGADGVEQGLADAVMSPQEAFSELTELAAQGVII